MNNNTENWFRQELLKDQKDILKHKKKIIEEIKKSSIQEVVNKYQSSETKVQNKGNSGIWEKIKKSLKF
jgi:predicted RND superfamily exporter protein